MPAPVRSLRSTSRRSGARNGIQNMKGNSSRKVNIDISGPDGIVTFYVPVDRSMQKLLKRFCQLKYLDYQGMDFSYKGSRVQMRRTVDELRMVEGDHIDAFVRVSPGVGDKSRKITINIEDMDGFIVTFSIPVDLPLHKLLKRYCEHRQLEYPAMLFLDHSGERIQVRRTASELHMVEGDRISAFIA